MAEPCPFCGKPIVREYGSFRCKHCAGSSEDLIDMERKARAAEVRKQTRVVKGGAAVLVPPAEVVVTEPPRAPRATKHATAVVPAKGDKSAAPARTGKSKTPAAAAPKESEKPPTKASSRVAAISGSATPAPRPTKSARLRMVSAAAARIAERKKSTPAEEVPPPPPAKKASRKAR